MTRRMVGVVAVVLMLAACSTKPKTDGTVMGEGDLSASERTPVTGFENVEGTGQTTYGPDPGTQQDLVVNIGDRVFFDFDRYDVKPEGRTVLERQAQWMQTYPNVNVVIEGHCDERGTREYNLALGERRAQAVRNYLTSLGVSSSRIETISYGKERPAVLGSNEDAWSQNRRGVTVVK